jgi:hypothetical protein
VNITLEMTIENANSIHGSSKLNPNYIEIKKKN